MQEPEQVGNDNLKILLLEDYELDAELVKRELRTSHPRWQVTHVSDRQHFVEALKKAEPDCVISDFAMPQYSGMEAFFTIKELGLEVPFIIVTGELPEEVAVKCINEGIDDYVIKSSLMRLGVSIQKAVDKHRVDSEKAQISQDLVRSDHQYRSIFNNAGVAICEFIVPELYELSDRFMLDRDTWCKASVKEIRKVVSRMNLVVANDEMISLFRAKDQDHLRARFTSILPDSFDEPLIKILDHLSAGEDDIITTAKFRTLTGQLVSLRCKITCLSRSEKRFIASWVDLTDVWRSEERLNKVLSRLEQTVAMRTQELSSANEKLTIQAQDKERVNQMMRENYIQMTDSIIAAKRIQQLMLPSMQSIADSFADTFVYLRPRDIVSGDFYWFYRHEHKCWIAAVDCTGHGVPGAFMSMIGSKILNQIVIEQQTLSTAHILKSIDEYVIQEFKQHESGTEISTGMDISLCSFDMEQSMMRFSGAFQSLFVVSDDELTELKADRFSLGGTFKHADKEFTEYKMSVKQGDCLYMLTDGFVDQFGGPSNKKYMRKQLKELLLSVQGQGMYDQEMAIKSSLQDWKGTCEQIDDILVIGLKI